MSDGLDVLLNSGAPTPQNGLDVLMSTSAPTTSVQPSPSIRPQAAPPSWIDQQLAKVNIPQWLDKPLNQIRGYVMGAADPSVGLVQMAANALPNASGIPQAVNQAIAAKNQQYEQERQLVGRSGIDATRAVGNLTSPVNLVAANAMPSLAGASIPKLAGVGGLAGAATSASMPVADSDSGYWGTKLAQAIIGGATGAVATPAIGKAFEALAPQAEKFLPNLGSGPSTSDAQSAADAAVNQALKETGQSANDIPSSQMQTLQDRLASALNNGNQLDAAAVARKTDFESLGIDPLQGQITRDPTQFAIERNTRGLGNAGQLIMDRLSQQNQQLQGLINGLRGQPSESFQAGTAISDAAAGIDKSMQNAVTQAYTTARNSAGKDLEVPLSGVAQDYASVLNDFGDKVPSGVRNNFESLGLMSGSQKKTFTIEDVDRLQKVINQNWSNDPATNLALGKLNGSLKDAVNAVDTTGGPFANAVNLAKQRFQIQEAVPALKAAATGSVAPDDFVRRFVVSGKTNEVNGLAALLRDYSPDAFAQAKAQIGDTLARSAFSTNIVGDNIFTPSRYADALRKIGTDKLSAFYSPDEITQLKTIGRVGAYINTTPSAAPVNYSNTASAMDNLINGGIGLLPGGRTLAAMIQNARQTVSNNATVANALSGEIPIVKRPMSPAENEMLARLLIGGGSFVGGSLPFGNR